MPTATMWKRTAWALAWMLPALWIAVLVYRFGIDVPHFDQWNGLAPLFEKSEAGALQFADFYAQHNEHRLLFPRLVMYGLARLTHWDVRVELFVVWLLGCACALNLMNTAAATGFDPFKHPALMLGVTALVFTPIGWENWLWGFQIGFLMPVACFTASLWVAPSARYPWNLINTALLCLISTFSIGSGFLYWLVLFPLLLVPGGKLRWKDRKAPLAAYLACFFVCTLLYFFNYKKPAHLPALGAALTHPVRTVQCVLGVLGNPFAHGTALDTIVVAQFVGAVLLLLLLAVLVMFWRSRADERFVARALPWLVLAAFACVNALAIAVGRIGIGLADSALTSRYTPYGAALPIALLFLVSMPVEGWRSRGNRMAYSRFVARALTAIVSVFTLLHALGVVAITRVWREEKRARLVEKSVVLFTPVVSDDALLSAYVHPDPKPLPTLISTLDAIGYLRPLPIHSDAIREIVPHPSSDPASYGAIEHSGRSAEGTYLIAGWAVLPNKMRPADAVLLTYDDSAGEPRIFAMTVAYMPRADVTEGPYQECGWLQHIDLARLPGRVGRIRAWAFDAEEKRAYATHGIAVAS